MPAVRVHTFAHVYHQHPNLRTATLFLVDFGSEEAQWTSTPTRVFYRGCGTQLYIYVAEQFLDSERQFTGGMWNLKPAGDLDVAASSECAVTGIVRTEGPGGESMVTLKDHVRFIVNLTHGQKADAGMAAGHSETSSQFLVQRRRLGKLHRLKNGPNDMYNVRHYGLVVPQTKLSGLKSIGSNFGPL